MNGRNHPSIHDIELRLTLLGKERRRMGAEILRFEAVAQEAARKVAEDFVHENTNLCARCDGPAYEHAIKDLTAMLAGHIAADLSEGTRLWLAQREAGES